MLTGEMRNDTGGLYRYFGSEEDHVPEQGDPEADEDGAGDLIDHGKRFDRQFICKFAGHHYLSDIGGHIYQEADGKNDDAFVEGMVDGEDGGISKPEEDHARVEGIDDKAGGEDAGHVAFAEAGSGAIGIFRQGCFFKESEVNAHADKEKPADRSDDAAVFVECGDQGGERIAECDEDDIADPYAGDKTEAAFMPVIQALFDNGKNDRAHRQRKSKS